ncbi:hypothetical protein Tb10.6k15.3520 [Trypanosoma brucei brucei TREU927]|uniref:Uncharacterized protein n=1 Tax=Trypanosoma brucei brucei (strain 927/4 GUTat10.1) TaxID=185431 RepID=Q38AP6_TRYB2|nr:hypothetical protein Tb10.6k15.3520 [Trypanosoma brucei brucei TREU927]EAN78124.1 hypothetical protein Tb10.6k15.3520 [Trypanosoma brucei brucei TREU927]
MFPIPPATFVHQFPLFPATCCSDSTGFFKGLALPVSPLTIASTPTALTTRRDFVVLRQPWRQLVVALSLSFRTPGMLLSCLFDQPTWGGVAFLRAWRVRCCCFQDCTVSLRV